MSGRASEEPGSKWQPVLLILDRRLECACGALAVIVTGLVGDPETGDEEAYNCVSNVDVWCQDCFAKAQEEME